MHLDPFSKNGLSSSGGSGKPKSSLDEIFVKSKTGGLGRRAAPAELLEPMEIPAVEVAPGPEKKKASVILSNPKWEVEKVGFNEETQVSVELELPENIAHKTKVAFELFANTPKGPERISQGEGKAEAGKAICTVPVYIPTYKDEDGNRMQKAEYFFTAKHSESDPLDGSKAPKIIDEMADRLIKFHVLPDLTFGFDKSYLHPNQADALKKMCDEIKSWREENPDGKLAIYGHADAVGKEDYNKKLSERRAKSVFGLLMKDPEAWEELQKEEKWDLAPIQDLLKHLGHDPGASDGKDGPKTQAAVKAFQGTKSLPSDGVVGADTRKALFRAFMDEHNPLALKKKDFDDINGNPHAGCSEFNRMDSTEGSCETNRRVTVLLLKSNKNFPITHPCQKGDIGPCKKQVARKGERRTAGFGCFFYDQLVTETVIPGGNSVGTVRIGLPFVADTSTCGEFRVKVSVGGKDVLELPMGDCVQGEEGVFHVSIENPQPGELYTVIVLQKDQLERVAIKDYEFHRYLKQLQDGESDFPRPEVVPWGDIQSVDEDADGDTVGEDPVEMNPEWVARIPSNLGEVYA